MDYKYHLCKVELKDKDTVVYTNPMGKKFDGSTNSDDVMSKTIRRFKDYWVEKYSDECERDDFVILGSHLYEVLFPCGSEIREEFERNCNWFFEDMAKSPNQRLRLQLIFHKEAKDLAEYPWEFLYMSEGPHRSFFLAGEKTELILTRFVPEAKRVKGLKPEEKPLRILLVFARPKCLEEIHPEEAIEKIRALHRDGYIEVEYVEHPHYDQLRKEIEVFEPHIFHFIGHGRPGQLALLRKEEEKEPDHTGKVIDVRWHTSAEVSDLFNVPHPPRLAFLHACHGATPTSIDGFNSIALELVYSSIPAVVAMQYKIENKDARIFAEKFYEEISRGMPIDEAAKAGRRELGQTRKGRAGAWGDRRFGTPVIYLQSESAIVVPGEPPPPPGGTKPPGPEPPSKVLCPSPDCDGLVAPTQQLCLKCKSRLTVCPGEGCSKVILDGLPCPFCLYGLEEAELMPISATDRESEITLRPGERPADEPIPKPALAEPKDKGVAAR